MSDGPDAKTQRDTDAIEATIREMSLVYDTRLLSLVLLSNGTALYQAMVSADVRTPNDAADLFIRLLEIAVTPTKEKPRVIDLRTDHPRRTH